MTFPRIPAVILAALFLLTVSFCILKLADKRMAPQTEITEILMTDTEKRNQTHGI